MDEWWLCGSRAGKLGKQGGLIHGLRAADAAAYCAAMTHNASRSWAWPAVAAGCALAMGGQWVLAQRPPATGAAPGMNGQLWIQAVPVDDRQQLLLVVDPQLRNAAVYHVDGPTGSLVLKSTRNITWDLMVGDFNAQEPKPAALRRMLEVGAETGPIGQNRP